LAKTEVAQRGANVEVGTAPTCREISLIRGDTLRRRRGRRRKKERKEKQTGSEGKRLNNSKNGRQLMSVIHPVRTERERRPSFSLVVVVNDRKLSARRKKKTTNTAIKLALCVCVCVS